MPGRPRPTHLPKLQHSFPQLHLLGSQARGLAVRLRQVRLQGEQVVAHLLFLRGEQRRGVWARQEGWVRPAEVRGRRAAMHTQETHGLLPQQASDRTDVPPCGD